VVYLGPSPKFSFFHPSSPNHAGLTGAHLLLEIARQAFLVAARDEIGLPTRDSSLGDEMPRQGENAPFEVVAVSGSGSSSMEVRRGAGTPPTTLLHRDIKTTFELVHDWRTPNVIQIVDHRSLLVDAEALSRGGFVDALKKAGFGGKPHAWKDSAAVPANIDQVLEEMNFVSQFSAVRQLHALISADGESPERLGALVRGYANLGLLTEFHWHPAHKAFEARSLVYAQRMMARDKRPWRAAWHRAYAFALAGMLQYALEDLQTAERQWEAAGKDAGPQPAWVKYLDAYCHFTYGRLDNEGKVESEDDLEVLLWYDCVAHCNDTFQTLKAAAQTVRRLPDCYPAMDALCEYGGVSVQHMATALPFMVAGKQIYQRILEIPGLPKPVGEIARSRPKSLNEEFNVEEFAVRAKLIRALLDGDGRVGGPAADSGEPSWPCLRRMVSNLSFVHVWRRAHFQYYLWSVPCDDFLAEAAPLVEAHPYRQFMATFARDAAARDAAWRKVTISVPDDLEFQEGVMWREYFQRDLPGAKEIPPAVGYGQDMTFREFRTEQDNSPMDNVKLLLWRLALKQCAPDSPTLLAVDVMLATESELPKHREWEKLALQYPAVARAYYNRARLTGKGNDAEKWHKVTAATGSIEALLELAHFYATEGKMDKWLATLEESLKAEDTGLYHAGAQALIASYYLRAGQVKKAAPYAEAAGESYSEWGLRVYAECLEASHDWDAAEKTYKAIYERYRGNDKIAEWYCFCRRTNHGDLDAARRAYAEATKPGPMPTVGHAMTFCLLEDRVPRGRQLLEFLVANEKSALFELHLALIADQQHDNAARDKYLASVAKSSGDDTRLQGEKPATRLAALAKLFVADLAKGGKGDIGVDAAERLNSLPPFDGSLHCSNRQSPPVAAFWYLLGHYLDMHGKPDLAVVCWKHCLDDTERMGDFHRTLAAVELFKRKITYEPATLRPEKEK